MLRRRRRLARSRLWPACLCSTDVRDDQDTYTAAPPVTPTHDDDASMAAMTSPDVDVGDGLYTIHLSGGAPFGFRLSDDEGRLVVSKVCRPTCAIASFFSLLCQCRHRASKFDPGTYHGRRRRDGLSSQSIGNILYKVQVFSWAG